MKTAVSLPDDLFQLAEAAAKQLNLSRSKLYAEAIAEYINRRRAASVTRRLDEIYGSRPAKVDRALLRAQLQSLDKESW